MIKKLLFIGFNVFQLNDYILQGQSRELIRFNDRLVF